MTEQPRIVELPRSPISGLDAAQLDSINRAPFVDRASKVHRLGSGYARRIQTAVGLWYWGATPCGDWSGTTQVVNEDGDMGSGGPAGIPFSTCGHNTVMAVGACRAATGDAGYTTTRAPLNRPFRANIATDPELSTWTYKIAWRKVTQAVISWNSAASVGSKVAANVTGDPLIPDCQFTARTPSDETIIIDAPSGEDFDAYTFTGDDWLVVHKVDPVGGILGRPGWYRIKSKPSSTEIELTPDAHIIHTDDTLVDCFIVQSAQAKYANNCTFLDEDTFTVSDLPVDGDTVTIGAYTHTFRTAPSLANEVLIGVTVEACVAALAAAWAEHPLVEVLETDTDFITVRARTNAVHTTAHTWATSADAEWAVGQVSRNAVYKVGAFDSLASDDDTLELYTGDAFGRYYALVAGDANALYVDAADNLGSPGDTGLNVVHFKRYPFVERDVDVANTSRTGPGSNPVDRCAWTGTLGTAHGWNDDAPKRGDFYIVWATQTSDAEPQVQWTNPESCPTVTERNHLGCWFPYGTPSASRRVSYVANYGNQPAAEEGSQIHSYWHGTFFMPRESFLIGDRLTIRTVSDLQMWGNPIIVEVLVIPGFDPAADWYKESGLVHLDRLLAGNGKIMWFQSPIIEDVDGNLGFNITLEGQAGFIQTINANEKGTNSSQQWTCTFSAYGGTQGPYSKIVSGTGGGANTLPRGFPATVGPVAHISLTSVENWSGLAYPVTVLIKTEHPSMINRPGFHGYYPGEPFSIKTGNGGTLMYPVGQAGSLSGLAVNADNQYTSPLPYGGTWRVATVSVEHVPGGMF